MTPDQKQINDLAGILAHANNHDMTHRQTAELLIKALQPTIATALREARAQALEEAASKFELPAYKRSIKGHDAAEICRALKQKE